MSSGVGVFYFERSGNLNYEAEQQSVPVLEAAWDAAGEAKNLRSLGLETTYAGSGDPEFLDRNLEATGVSLSRMQDALSQAGSVPELFETASQANESAQELANVANALAGNRAAALDAAARAGALEEALSRMPAGEGTQTLRDALRATSTGQLEDSLDEFRGLVQSGVDPRVSAVAGGDDGVFASRRLQLALEAQRVELTALFDGHSQDLESETNILLEQAQTHASETLNRSVESFDQGRILLAVISIVSMAAATIAAWFWVGNAVVRRLSALSERMRGMVQGDLETPVPEVGRDEIGQLAYALEHFRQQALEVQRLNLVEQLYGELREANDELQRMQARLVAQEKLAALGELVSGVAHEISNPLNFVKNFSEGSLDLYQELAEMLENYRDRLSEDDATLLDELTAEITDSLGRVSYNGGRALAIVERMRSLSSEGGNPVLTDLNSVLRQAAQQGYDTFTEGAEGFKADIAFELDAKVGMTMLTEREFGEAVLNLVTNACFAMEQKKAELGEEYSPSLRVSSLPVDGAIEVRIRDNGPGIADDVKDRIFNPFFTTQGRRHGCRPGAADSRGRGTPDGRRPGIRHRVRRVRRVHPERTRPSGGRTGRGARVRRRRKGRAAGMNDTGLPDDRVTTFAG